MRAVLLLIFPLFFVFGCANAQDAHFEPDEGFVEETVKPKLEVKQRHDDHDQPRPYDGERDAMADVDTTLQTAKINGKKALIVMGANWCHDSRGLAERFEREEFQSLLADNYELVYVSAGTKPRQNDQNREVSARFGVEKIEGTPTVFIVDADENVLNAESTGYWRKADSIPVDMSFAYFEHYANK